MEFFFAVLIKKIFFYLRFYPLVLHHHARYRYRYVLIMVYGRNDRQVDIEAVQYIYMNVMAPLGHHDQLLNDKKKEIVIGKFIYLFIDQNVSIPVNKIVAG